MLSNLPAGNLIAEDAKINFATYFHTLKESPSKIASLLAIFIIPSAALGWWYYSLAMSVGAVMPLQTTANTSEESILSKPHTISEIQPDDSTSSSPSSSVSTDQIDLKINSSSSQTGVVEIDGQSISIPADGSTHQVIQNDNGKTTIDINVDSDTSGTSKSRSSTNINLRSSSDTDVDIKSEEKVE